MGARVTEAAAASPAARAYAEAPPPDRSAAWRELTYAVLDFETTGLRPAGDEIVSFATVPIEAARSGSPSSRYRLVRPRRMPGAESIRIHGLRPADLEDAPPFEDVLDELLEALAGRVHRRPRRRGRARVPGGGAVAARARAAQPDRRHGRPRPRAGQADRALGCWRARSGSPCTGPTTPTGTR